jgi:hypothetical protein
MLRWAQLWDPREDSTSTLGAFRCPRIYGRREESDYWRDVVYIVFVLAEFLTGHMIAAVLVLPFLLNFSGISNKKLLIAVPMGIMVLTT